MKKNFFLIVFFLVVPSALYAFDDLPNESPEIDPPPAPIAGILFYLFVGAVLLSFYFFYRSNLKIRKNE